MGLYTGIYFNFRDLRFPALLNPISPLPSYYIIAGHLVRLATHLVVPLYSVQRERGSNPLVTALLSKVAARCPYAACIRRKAILPSLVLAPSPLLLRSRLERHNPAPPAARYRRLVSTNIRRLRSLRPHEPQPPRHEPGHRPATNRLRSDRPSPATPSRRPAAAHATPNWTAPLGRTATPPSHDPGGPAVRTEPNHDLEPPSRTLQRLYLTTIAPYGRTRSYSHYRPTYPISAHLLMNRNTLVRLRPTPAVLYTIQCRPIYIFYLAPRYIALIHPDVK